MARSDKTTETKAAADATADAPVADPADTKDKKGKGGSNAPRPRKWDYGIAPEAQIIRAAEEPSVKRDVANEWGYTEGNPSCEVFFTRGGTRHGLRVMSRRKLINVLNGGVTYPIEYVAPEKPAKEEKKPEEKAEETAAA